MPVYAGGPGPARPVAPRRPARLAALVAGGGGRYGHDVLAGDHRRRPLLTQVAAVPGLVLEDAETGFCGAVVRWEKTAGGVTVTLEDRRGRHRVFPAGPGFLLDGSPVEKVWGDDLREVGVVVEHLGGIDDLAEEVRAFSPGPGRRHGVLVDHLVTGTKESRIAATVAGPHVLVRGHPYVDVWQAVRPSVLGIAAWPTVPRGIAWKDGICAALGWPADPAAAWRRILGAVRGFADLDPSLLGRVEELIDFVTADVVHP